MDSWPHSDKLNYSLLGAEPGEWVFVNTSREIPTCSPTERCCSTAGPAPCPPVARRRGLLQRAVSPPLPLLSRLPVLPGTPLRSDSGHLTSPGDKDGSPSRPARLRASSPSAPQAGGGCKHPSPGTNPRSVCSEPLSYQRGSWSLSVHCRQGVAGSPPNVFLRTPPCPKPGGLPRLLTSGQCSASSRPVHPVL